MLSKQKASICEWCECLKCKKIVNNRDLNLHSKQCVGEEEGEELLSGRKSKVELNHGYIYQRNLYGIVASVTDGELSSVEQLVSNLPKSIQKNLLYVHPSCLSLCNLSIGQPCIVDGEYVQIVWPCLSVNPSIVGLSVDLQEKLGKKSKDFVLVSSLNQAHLQAESLDLKSTNKKDFYSKDEFKEFLQQEIDGKFFTKGNTFSFHYFGQPCSFTVSDIQGFTEKVEITIPGGCDLEDSLSKKLRNIKISGNGAPNNESETILDSHLKSEKQDKDASLIDNSLMEDSSTAEIDRNMESVKKEMGAESPSTPKTKNLDPRKEETNIESPATPKLNPCKNDSVISGNSSDNQNQNALSPLGTSTPLSKMSEKNIPGFQTLPQNNAKSEFPHSGKIFFKVSSHTKIRVNSSGKKNKKDPKTLKDNSVTFDAIGGLKPQIAALKEIIQLSTVSPKIFASYGLTYPKGILLHGPSGCGKTFLMKAFATEMGCYVTKISGPNIWSKFYGETEKRLTEIFKTAQERSPSLILMDELDTLCPKRNDSANELEKRVVSTLLSLMDDLSNSTFEKLTLVVAATNKLDLVDAALRRPGRFDQEIEIGIPTAEDRHDILQKLLSQTPNTVLPEELKRISDAAHGFVGADLLAVCKEANLLAIKSQKDKSKFQVTDYHLTSGFNKVQPSAMRQVQLEVPKVRWSDIGGQEEVKQKLKQAIEWPLKHPEVFIRMGIQPPKGILLYGPPGCSKTMIAKALATESGLNFIAIKGPELFNKWVGESEKAVREVFRKARAAAPAVVFFDEIDALAVERGSSSGSSSVEDRVLAQLLTELDGVEKLEDVTVVAATNRPDMIDKALLRPGRIDRIMYVPLPDRKTREEIFRIHMKKMPFAKDVDVENLAEKTERYSGAEVSAVCYEAALFAMEEDFKGEEIQEKHFKKSLEIVRPRITDALIEFYENYEQKSSLHPV